MNIGPTGSVKAMVPPVTLEDWRQCEADLRQRHRANGAERDQIAQQRQESALAAARGDTGSQKHISKLADREADLHLASASLDQGLIIAAQEIDAWEAIAAQENRASELLHFREKLTARLIVIAEIERLVRDVTPLLDRLAVITREIEQVHASLGGTRPILPPLAQEAVGGRLAEFMAGNGFADWLPVVRPEIRPAITSWLAAEQAVQQTFQLDV